MPAKKKTAKKKIVKRGPLVPRHRKPPIVKGTNTKRYTDKLAEKFADELVAVHGNRAEACRNIGIGYRTVTAWLNEYDYFRECMQVAEEKICDAVEASLVKSAKSGNNVAAQIFYLKNRRPDRYKDDAAVQINVANAEEISGEIERLIKDSDGVYRRKSK